MTHSPNKLKQTMKNTFALLTFLLLAPLTHADDLVPWRALDLHNGLGRATVTEQANTLKVEGCIRRNFESQWDTTLVDSQTEIYLPAQSAQWASAALCIFGPDDSQRLYAMIVFNKPGQGADQVELSLLEKKRVTKKLPRDAWVKLRLQHTETEWVFKVWPVGTAEPTEGDLRMPNSELSWEPAGYGPRTYAVAGSFRNLTVVEGKPTAANLAWRSSIPRPVFDADPTLVTLYHKAWQLAWKHIKTQSGIPRSPYMDEACWDNTIWIWDTCFMSLFCKYAPDYFPGVESLENFYLSMYGNATTALRICHTDNPPLFAWVEYDYFKFTNDQKHLEQLINRDQYLQKHYAWFANPTTRSKPTALRAEPKGYRWNGEASGMDNTPRDRYGEIYWVDALAQQGLSALYLTRLAETVGNTVEATRWKNIYQAIKKQVNELYWDDTTGAYYDVNIKTNATTGILTPAAFWPMLAEMCSPGQAAQLVKHLENPQELGGTYPWVTLARNHKDFDAETGNYWRGGIWLPTSYMGIKALEKYGYDRLADETAARLLAQMNDTFKNYTPHTIWECYNPNKAEPSTENGKRARPDFCGWSALGPISLFIENILGFRTVDAQKNEVHWRLYQKDRHGLEHLRFGKIDTDIIYDGKGQVNVTANEPYILVINGARHQISKGQTSISVNARDDQGRDQKISPMYQK